MALAVAMVAVAVAVAVGMCEPQPELEELDRKCHCLKDVRNYCRHGQVMKDRRNS